MYVYSLYQVHRHGSAFICLQLYLVSHRRTQMHTHRLMHACLNWYCLHTNVWTSCSKENVHVCTCTCNVSIVMCIIVVLLWREVCSSLNDIHWRKPRGIQSPARVVSFKRCLCLFDCFIKYSLLSCIYVCVCLHLPL